MKQNTYLTLEQIDILNGILLGDGYLTKQKGKNTNPYFRIKSITKSFIEKIQSVLPFKYSPINIQPKHESIILGRNTKLQETYTLSSTVDLSLIDIYNKWYQPKKIVPPNLVLTPLTVKYWFYGDGSTNWIKQHNNLVNLQLFTNSFTFLEVQYLISRLETDCNLYGFNIQKSSLGAPIIQTSKTNLIQQFFNYIGNCDVDGFKYKWKIPYKKVIYVYNPKTHYHKSIIIDDIEYISQAKAARVLGVCQHTIGRRKKRGI